MYCRFRAMVKFTALGFHTSLAAFGLEDIWEKFAALNLTSDLYLTTQV